MLTTETLNRVSHSYRRGYYDGYDQKPRNNLSIDKTENGIPLKPFSDFDYNEGYLAGLNDFYWENFRSGKIKITRAEFLYANGGLSVK